MIMADGSSGMMMPGGEITGLDDNGGDGEDDDLSMDLDTFYTILEEEPPDASLFKKLQSTTGDLSDKDLEVVPVSYSGNDQTLKLQSGSQTTDRSFALEEVSVDPASYYHLHNPECLDTRTGNSGVSFDFSGKEISSSMHASSRSFIENCSPFQADQEAARDGVLHSEIASCSTVSTYGDGDSNRVASHADILDLNLLLDENGNQFRHLEGQVDSKGASSGPSMDGLDEKLGSDDALVENSLGIPQPEDNIHKSRDVSLRDADDLSYDMISTKTSDWDYPDFNCELGDGYSEMQFGVNAYDAQYTNPPHFDFSGAFNFGLMHGKLKNNEFQPESAWSGSEIFEMHYSDVNGMNFKYKGNDHVSPINGNFSSNVEHGLIIDDKASVMPSSCMKASISKDQTICIEREKIDEVVPSGNMTFQSCEGVSGVVDVKYPWSGGNSFMANEDKKQSFSGVPSSVQNQKHVIYTKNEKGGTTSASLETQVEGIAGGFSIGGAFFNLNASELYLPFSQTSKISSKQLTYDKDAKEGKPIQANGQSSHLAMVSPESIQSNSSGSKSHVDDDSDLCILDDISQPACSNQSLALRRPIDPLQHPVYSNTVRHPGVEGTRFRANDERFVLRVALQDLAQPKSEAVPPDGLLTVPLLRHQRIALSWMVQKETSSLHCSGGILADDQGLGKTVSTIALILKERPPSHRGDAAAVRKEECETLNLDDDDDDDGIIETDRVKKNANVSEVASYQSLRKSPNSSRQTRGRLAAGTLIVCPTSVLRQWADELNKKVTSEANISVLVYHGSNRTKDPSELAKYDVVLTTYSIVSMEVPKQPLADEDDDEKRSLEGDDVPRLGLSHGKKRKYPPSSSKKGPRNKKGMDSAMLESIARPLAKVAWFRIVLDEAQSIKNHRTQVARACWGLRAKRRWCLSGTPIQNAIDDLYSYFRFLRYDPYAVYKLFCSTIKVPIQKNPTKGYRKLQAVLRTIMLRRTKGTLLDGEPIINLPPKVVELKKVDFTDEERDFYTRLETDSRDQFKEYAAAGTVKQNYVNILLMLLRLRQACDHPLLVRGLESSSLESSSIEMAKKLPREKRFGLLNCLEGSLAICGICSDPPEDAVVSVCSHVFCRQCLCEHLTGDDNQCPASNCKVRLNVSSVFSKCTLNSSLSDNPGQGCSGSELLKPFSSSCNSQPYDSSKIRAALEVLQSLTKPKDCLSTCNSSENSSDGNAVYRENSSASTNSLSDGTDKRNPNAKVVGEKAIVFSQWTGMLDMLERCLKNSNIRYRRLDGTMSVVARDKAVKDFNTLPEVSVMIMSLKAASLGLNMVAACHVLLLDLWWNPTTEDQAIDRAHRIGQTRTVTVLRLTVKDTVEDRILALQQKKREMVASAFGEDGNAGRQTRLTVDDLNYLFMV